MVGFHGASRPCRPQLGRALLVLLSAIAILTTTAGHAFSIESLRKYAAVVVDAKSGEVLYDKEADARRYPASLTKVMTLYILFQELEAGNVRLTDRMTVSEHAAASVPTKLGLKPGWTITVADAMKSLVTISANDMAAVIAEHISGSEPAFAARMTATARALGMNDTTYRNASGLPDAAQVTTARDQATLGIAVNQHFPQYYELFQTTRFTHAGRSYGNHNRLLGSNGVDGIKTGYIKASGFNLLTAARRDDRHIVVAAIGSNTGGARDNRVRELVKTYLSKGRAGTYLEAALIPEPERLGAVRVAVAQPVTPKPYPSFRAAELRIAGLSGTPAAPSAIDAANLLGSGTTGKPSELRAPVEEMAAWVGETHALTTGPVVTGEGDTAVPEPATTDTAPDAAESDAADARPEAADPKPEPRAVETAALSPAPPPAPPPSPSPGWVVQVGAAPSPEGADTLLNAAVGAVEQLRELQPYVQRFEQGGQVFYRARFAGFGALKEARGMCKRLLAVEMTCLALLS